MTVGRSRTPICILQAFASLALFFPDSISVEALVTSAKTRTPSRPLSPRPLPIQRERPTPPFALRDDHEDVVRPFFGRRALVLSGAAALIRPGAAAAVVLRSPASFVAEGAPPRVDETGIGGGFDIVSPRPSALRSDDCIFPASMLGRWVAQRAIISAEGDLGQAAIVWKTLGGGDERAFTSRATERYEVRFVDAPAGIDSSYRNDGRSVRGAILDRGFEATSRIRAPEVRWDPSDPGRLSYSRSGRDADAVGLTVVQRRIEAPNNEGFGSDELYRIGSSAGGLFGSGGVIRCARVRQRFRRGFDDAGNRIVEGLEIMTTYRVLDGVAGVEMPTSTCKSRIRLTKIPNEE